MTKRELDACVESCGSDNMCIETGCSKGAAFLGCWRVDCAGGRTGWCRNDFETLSCCIADCGADQSCPEVQWAMQRTEWLICQDHTTCAREAEEYCSSL